MEIKNWLRLKFTKQYIQNTDFTLQMTNTTTINTAGDVLIRSHQWQRLDSQECNKHVPQSYKGRIDK